MPTIHTPSAEDDSIIPSMETPVNTVRVVGATFRARNTVPFALSMAAVAAFSFLSGGYVLGRNTPVAVALLCAAAVWVWFLRRSTRPPVLFLLALGVFAAFTVWAGLSVLWSFGPDLTWVSFNLTAFYLAVVAVLGLTSARALQLWTVAYGYLAVATAVGIYAFLGKGLPAVVTHAHTYARLDSPVGYWNVLALMMVMGLCVALAIAGDRRTGAALRTVAAAAAVPMCFTFFFTLSRGGWIALAVALVLYFVFTTTRLASFVTLAAVVTPVGARPLAAARPQHALHGDDRRRAAHVAGRRAAALGDRGAARDRGPAVGGRPAAPGGALAALVDHRRRRRGAGGRRGGRRRWPRALRPDPRRRSVGQGQAARAAQRVQRLVEGAAPDGWSW